MKKASGILLNVFAYGIIVCLFAGGASLLGYLVGLMIGGENAAALCAWIFRTYLPWVIRTTSLLAGVGLVGMYLGRQKALTVSDQGKAERKR